MRYVIGFILFGCSYNDCIVNTKINEIDAQLSYERGVLQKLTGENWNTTLVENIINEMDIIESLELEKFILQNQKCK